MSIKWLMIVLTVGTTASLLMTNKHVRAALPGGVDREISAEVEKMNKRLPLTTGVVRLESVEYANLTMTMNGSILDNNAVVTDEGKRALQKQMLNIYCASPFRQKNVKVIYHFQQLAMRSLGEKLHNEVFDITVKPGDC